MSYQLWVKNRITRYQMKCANCKTASKQYPTMFCGPCLKKEYERWFKEEFKEEVKQ